MSARRNRNAVTAPTATAQPRKKPASPLTIGATGCQGLKIALELYAEEHGGGENYCEQEDRRAGIMAAWRRVASLRLHDMTLCRYDAGIDGCRNG